MSANSPAVPSDPRPPAAPRERQAVSLFRRNIVKKRKTTLMSANSPAVPSDPRPPAAPRERQAVSLFRRDIVRRALIDSLIKLDPRGQIRNPGMFVGEIGRGRDRTAP